MPRPRQVKFASLRDLAHDHVDQARKRCFKRGSMNHFPSFSRIQVVPTLGAVALILGLSCPSTAIGQVKQYVRVTSTQHLDLPANGTVRVTHSLDELTIEGWDQPGVEITTIKSTKYEYAAAEKDKAAHELDSVKISAELKGNELVIATAHPRHRAVKLTYLVKVARDTRLIVDGSGEVHFDGVAGDIQADMHGGLITLRLPNEGQYGIDARTKLGNIISDYPGDTKRRAWVIGRNFTGSAQAPHKLVLKEGFGDIVIIKAAAPDTPAKS
jgi:hypothetical protein